MTNEAIKQAGLLRCCVSHLSEIRAADPNPPTEDAVEICRYCNGQIIWADKAWRWPYPVFTKLQSETML